MMFCINQTKCSKTKSILKLQAPGDFPVYVSVNEVFKVNCPKKHISAEKTEIIRKENKPTEISALNIYKVALFQIDK